MDPQLLQRFEEVERKVNALYASGDLPHDVEQAFRTRFKLSRLDDAAILSDSAKQASSEGQNVNEAGAASYVVLSLCDEFLETTVGGVTFYIPAYT